MKIVTMIIMMMVVDDANDSHDDNDDDNVDDNDDDNVDDNDDDNVDDNDDDNDDYDDNDRNHKQVKHTIDNVYSDDHDNSCIIGKASMQSVLPYPNLPSISIHTNLPTDRPIEPNYSTYSTNSTHLPNNLPTSVLVRMDK